MMKVLLIDNYDSFVYNLAQLVEETGLCDLDVISYDQVNEQLIEAYDKLIISPGPGIPSDFPRLQEYVLKYYKQKEILGVCLGQEAIALAFGGALKHSGKVFHGFSKSTRIIKAGSPIFKSIGDGFQAGLYHSWILDESKFPQSLCIEAVADDGVIMAISYQRYNLVGFQFHPESIMTPDGHQMIYNWLTFNS